MAARPIARSALRALVDAGTCIDCGSCVARCQFDALSTPEGGAARVAAAHCVGCGPCASA